MFSHWRNKWPFPAQNFTLAQKVSQLFLSACITTFVVHGPFLAINKMSQIDFGIEKILKNKEYLKHLLLALQQVDCFEITRVNSGIFGILEHSE